MEREYGEQNIIEGVTRVVDVVVGRTAVVHKILPQFGVQVWVKERGYERENWPWRMVTVRTPRLIKRYPRPFRFPREEPSKICHCKIGRIEVISEEEAICTRCKLSIGTESYPNRIERAIGLVRKAYPPKTSKTNPRNDVRQRVRRSSNRKATCRGIRARAKGKNDPCTLRLRQRGRKEEGHATKSKGTSVHKPARNVKRTKVPKARKRQNQKVPTSRRTHAVSKAGRKAKEKA